MTTHVISTFTDTTKTHETLLSQALGVIPYQPVSDQAHIFSFDEAKQRTFTMIFVFTPIDIIYLKDNVIVDKHQGFSPFTSHRGRPHNTAIELPPGTIRHQQMNLGDTVDL